MKWLSEAEKHKLVVGSEARILYSDQVGRVKIALAFNEAVATGKLKVSLRGLVMDRVNEFRVLEALHGDFQS